jgi:tetratricopeptide (TPR) repeat protein
LYTDSGQKEKALALYREFIEKYPEDPRGASVLLKAAQENLEMEKYDIAEKDYLKFLADHEKHPMKENALFQLGWLYMKQENYAKAAATYEKFVEEFPDSQAASSAVYWTGKAYQENQEWDKAIEAYSGIAFDKEDEFYERALESLAYTYFQKGDQNKAAEHYYTLITMQGGPDLPDGVYKWVADFYINGGLYDRSIKALDILSEKYPDVGESGEVLYMYGETYGRLKEWEKADDNLMKAIEKKAPSPYLERSYLALGKVYLAGGDHEKALGYLEEALKNHKDNRTGALARFEIGNVNFSKMNFEEAAKQYMMVAILYDDEELCPESLFRAGLSFEKAGKPEDALEAYRELIRRYPGKPFSREAADNVRRIESENR